MLSPSLLQGSLGKWAPQRESLKGIVVVQVPLKGTMRVNSVLPLGTYEKKTHTELITLAFTSIPCFFWAKGCVNATVLIPRLSPLFLSLFISRIHHGVYSGRFLFQTGISSRNSFASLLLILPQSDRWFLILPTAHTRAAEEREREREKSRQKVIVYASVSIDRWFMSARTASRSYFLCLVSDRTEPPTPRSRKGKEEGCCLQRKYNVSECIFACFFSVQLCTHNQNIISTVSA